MSGFWFIVLIPTEQHEKKLLNKPRKLFEKTSTIDQPEACGSREPLSTPHADLEYGTFSKFLTPSQDELLPQKPSSLTHGTASSSVYDNSPVSRNAANKHLSVANGHPLKKSKSFDHGLNSPQSSKAGEPNVIQKSWDGLKEIVSSGKQSKASDNKSTGLGFETRSLELSIESPMEQVMVELLKKFKIDNASWQFTHARNFYQITFMVNETQQEALLNVLHEWGIGDRDGSSISMVPCTFYNTPHEESGSVPQEEILLRAQKETAWNRFMSSMRARLNVAQIVHAVKQDATITFDFVSLVLFAGTLAAFGLVENSTIFLASSMLISPLMGPIIATIFGIVIKDKYLARLGLVNELIGISLATFVGFIFGLIFCSIDKRYAFEEFKGVTEEMKSRGELHSLLVGMFTAIPSGAAVAIAILGENIGSLVGVAISASLLPPAVNAGVLWALSILFLYHENDSDRFNEVINSQIYSKHQALELAAHGGISMLLTIINVLCIWIMGILVLKIKEVAPIVSKNQRQFWKYDIKVARDYNKTCHAGQDLQDLADEIADFQGADNEPFDLDAFRSIGRPVYQNTWSPMSTNRTIYARERRPTIADLELAYSQMAGPARQVERVYPHPVTGLGYTKTIMGKGRSPPKYRSLVNDHPFSGPSDRRASMPYISSIATLGLASHGLNMPGYGFRGPQLERINEMSQSSRQNMDSVPSVSMGEGPRQESSRISPTRAKKSRKFIVTPASDP